MHYERDGRIAYVQWKDRRTVTVLTTVHCATGSVDIDRNKEENGVHQVIAIKQPKCIGDYNSGMGGVDVFDQHITAYRVLRKNEQILKKHSI